jgi:hypothetical protein
LDNQHKTFEEITKDFGYDEIDLNNVLSIILLLSGETRNIQQISALLGIRSIKIKLYLDNLLKANVVHCEIVENQEMLEGFYSLANKNIIADLAVSFQADLNLQAKSLSIFLEESIKNLNKNDINLVTLAEVNLSKDSIQEIQVRLKELFDFIVAKDLEATKLTESEGNHIKRYSILATFVPSRVQNLSALGKNIRRKSNEGI